MRAIVAATACLEAVAAAVGMSAAVVDFVAADVVWMAAFVVADAAVGMSAAVVALAAAVSDSRSQEFVNPWFSPNHTYYLMIFGALLEQFKPQAG